MDILVVFLMLTGVILLTGASLASVIRATGSGLVDTSRMVRRLGEREPVSRRRGPVREPFVEIDGEDAVRPPVTGPPEPAPDELIVRATHVEAPSHVWDAEDENDDEAIEDDRGGGREAVDSGMPDDEESEAGDVEDEQLSGVARTDADALTPQGRLRGTVTDDPDFAWELPDARRLLTRSTDEQTRPDTAGQERIAASLVEALGHFGVQAKVIGTVAGPHITRYELRLAPGTKVAKVAQLKDDLAYALAATDIRILAPIPGKQAVGVEVPNAKRRIVKLGDVFQDPPKDWSPLTVWLGKDVAGKAIGADLAKMPHLLVAGTTGAGKSGAINAMLSSVLLRATPHEVRLGAGRPQAGGAQPLRVDPAPADARDHQPADGRERAAEPRQGDGAALRDHVAGAHAQPGRAATASRAKRGEAAAALHPVRDRRARRPDDGGAGRRRGLDHPPGPEGARGGHPSGARDAEPACRRDHRA